MVRRFPPLPPTMPALLSFSIKRVFTLFLIGDSLGMVLQGNDDTLPVTVEDMAYHTRCVKAGVEEHADY